MQSRAAEIPAQQCECIMTALFSDLSLGDLNWLLFIVLLSLIPLLIWLMWDLEQRRDGWLSRWEAAHALLSSASVEEIRR
jgi:hypothetical protein